VHAELLRDRGERSALSVACRGPGNRVIGHLADQTPPCDARSIKVGDHRRSVHLALTSEPIDRRTLAVATDQLIDLTVCKPPLDRV
jgi:hypothetical protein